jgi:hypothetical protein
MAFSNSIQSTAGIAESKPTFAVSVLNLAKLSLQVNGQNEALLIIVNSASHFVR